MIPMPTLFGIGVGPGDPELLTLKAQRIIQNVPVVAVPVAYKERGSDALDIVSGLLRTEQTIPRLHFPMVIERRTPVEKRRAASSVLAEYIHPGVDVAYLTEGDPLLHSAFGHLLQHLPEGIQVEIVPGVSSNKAASAARKLPHAIAGEKLAAMPISSLTSHSTSFGQDRGNDEG
jgi:precorrin-2/cobalt-factor-2 C20-methyltransferase